MKKSEVIGDVPIDEIMHITTLKEEIIPDKNGRISIISTGLKDAIIEVVNLNVLKGMKIKKDKMIDFCKRKDIVGDHVVSRETLEPDSDF